MFNVHMELDMTVRITARDQVTGADIPKLNALCAAVEALGGVIDYPPTPVTPVDDSWVLTNVTYQNNVANYAGGTMSIDTGGGNYVDLAAFTMHRPMAVGDSVRVRKASGDWAQLLVAVSPATTLAGLEESKVICQIVNLQQPVTWIISQDVTNESVYDFELAEFVQLDVLSDGVLFKILDADFAVLGEHKSLRDMTLAQQNLWVFGNPDNAASTVTTHVTFTEGVQ